MITLYGIKNCDCIKKARKWLDENRREYRFHDVRINGIKTETIAIWIDQIGWDRVLNKRSTSWRNLDNAVQQAVNAENVTSLLQENPTLIKRPVLDVNGIISVGFNIDAYRRIFN